MSRQGKWEYLKAIHARYSQAPRAEEGRILDEFCQVTGYHRKSALRLLNGLPPSWHGRNEAGLDDPIQVLATEPDGAATRKPDKGDLSPHGPRPDRRGLHA